MKPASILITDDESNIRMMVRTALESDGYSITEASNGRAALEAIDRTSPQLLVLDLNMPEFDGMAVLEHLKTLAISKPRVIVLTAYGSISTAVKATRLGAADFLEKPLTPTALRHSVRSVLGESDEGLRALPRLGPDYEGILNRIRRALRLADTTSAESLLLKVADCRDLHSAEYFNLLGALYETQQKRRLARKCYNRALDADATFAPARMNVRRIEQLVRSGCTTDSLALGDEASDLWYARLGETKG